MILRVAPVPPLIVALLPFQARSPCTVRGPAAFRVVESPSVIPSWKIDSSVPLNRCRIPPDWTSISSALEIVRAVASVNGDGAGPITGAFGVPVGMHTSWAWLGGFAVCGVQFVGSNQSVLELPSQVLSTVPGLQASALAALGSASIATAIARTPTRPVNDRCSMKSPCE